MRKFIFAATAFAVVLAMASARSQTTLEPGAQWLVTYGGGSQTKEGDPDHLQAIYFSVPASSAAPLYVRVFDPDAAGMHDQIATPGPNTTMRYTVFGGKGADTSQYAQPERLSFHERTFGTVLIRKSFRDEPEVDNVWVTLGMVEPSQGELVGDRYVFRLYIQGVNGNDGNIYDVAVSEREQDNVAPQGLRMYSYGLTTRTPVEGVFSELRFRIPDDAELLTIGTFDAADAELRLAQRFHTYELEPSGQDSWKKTTIALSKSDRGTEAAITLSGGTELPNDATYYVTDQAGRPIALELPVRLLKPNRRPLAVATARDAETCMSISFDASKSSDPDGDALTYHWLFGDDNRAEGENVTHTYRNEGRVLAWLEVYDSSGQLGNGSRVPVDVFVKNPPIPRSNWRNVVAANEDVTFDGGASTASQWRIARHEWRFSDGTTLTGAVVRHSFKRPGTYRVTHLVEDDSGHRCNTSSEEFELRVNAPPIAVAGPDQLVTASLVQFDGSASHDDDGDTIVRHDWDFGDGLTGTGATPKHVYARPGTYTVKLTVADSSGTARNTGSDTLRATVNARPIADAGPELVGAPGQLLTFDGSRSVDPDGHVAEYTWDFRDGATATGMTVSHEFANPGIYNVQLRVKDNTGHDEAIDFEEVHVFINAPPVAVAGPDVSAVPGDTVKLSASRSFDPDGEIASYRWDFSDEHAPMNGANVTRKFEKPGIYGVKLTVTDDSGAINANASSELLVAINHAPVAVAGETVITNETTISFDGTKSVDADGDALTYVWDFGDGAKAAGARVTHTYREGGSYPVVLVVDDGRGLKNSTSQSAISVRIDRAPLAVAGDNKTACTGDALVFDGSRSTDPEGGVLRYLWNFGDGSTAEIVNPTKAYKQGGLYPVTLTVRDDSGLPRNFSTSRIAVRVDQGPVANAGATEILACANNEITFDGSKSTDVDGVVNNYRWDFGDGNFGGGERPSHVYEKPGKYRAFLTVQGEKVGDCSDTSTDEIPVEIIAGPVAVIEAPDALPVTEAVSFDGSGSQASDGKITGWHWDFGDGNTASGAKVRHRYAKAGTYRVQLTISSNSPSPTCRAVSSGHVITINDPPRAIMKGKALVSVDEEVVFDATESSDPDGAIVNYEWDFADGEKGSGVIARHKFRSPGTYKVKLTVRDNAALANSATSDELAVTVNAPPVPVISGPEVACVGEKIAWSSDRSTDPDGKIKSFRWTFGDGADAVAPSAEHQYQSPGRYSLTLYADDGAALANSRRHVTRSIWVNRPPVAWPDADRIACPGQAVVFDGALSSDADGKLMQYKWDFGDGTTLDGVKVEHQFAKPGSYEVRLTVTDDSKSTCASNTALLNVLVKAPPVARAGGDREVWVGGANDAILLDGSKSSDPDGRALSYVWKIGEAVSAVGERVRQAIPSPGEYKSTLTVSDPSGLDCGTATDSFRIIARERK